MNEERLVSPESQTEPTWTEKVVALSRALGEAGIPYAFGGAIALNYHREPRSTLDIDINVFLAPDDEIAALSCLETLSGLPDRERVEHGLRDDGKPARSGAQHTSIYSFPILIFMFRWRAAWCRSLLQARRSRCCR